MARLEMSVVETSDSATAGGTPDALFELGLMYCAGREVELDLVSAHKWFNLAAMRGNDDAKRYRMEIAHEMSKAQIAEALGLTLDQVMAAANDLEGSRICAK